MYENHFSSKMLPYYAKGGVTTSQQSQHGTYKRDTKKGLVSCRRRCRGCLTRTVTTLRGTYNHFLPRRSRIYHTTHCDLVNNKGQVHTILILDIYSVLNNDVRTTRRFTTTMRVLRYCSLVRSSLPYVSGSSLHHNHPSYRGTFDRTATVLTNSILLARTFRAITGTPTSTSIYMRTTQTLNTNTNDHNVICKRRLSLGCRTLTTARSRLQLVRHGGANTLVGTTVRVNTTTTGTSRTRYETLRRCTCNLNLIFRVISSILSIADAPRRLNGPVNDSDRGKGAAFIALCNTRNTVGLTRSLGRRAYARLRQGFNRGTTFLRRLTRRLLIHGGWGWSVRGGKGELYDLFGASYLSVESLQFRYSTNL